MSGLPIKKWIKPWQARAIIVDVVRCGYDDANMVLINAIHDDVLDLRIVRNGEVTYVTRGSELFAPAFLLTYEDDEELEISRPSLKEWLDSTDRSDWPEPLPLEPVKHATDDQGIEAATPYTTPYIKLLFEAIKHFGITHDKQPAAKKQLQPWFLEQKVEGEPVSMHLAKAMTTIVRLPEMKKGGIYPAKKPGG